MLRAVPLRHRRRHRRRILGDQFGDPGADPRPLPRPHRPRDQRQLLARRGGRRDRLEPCCSHPGALPPDVGWRVGFGIGAVLGLGDPARCGASCRRVRAGCCCMGAPTKPNASLPRSSASARRAPTPRHRRASLRLRIRRARARTSSTLAHDAVRRYPRRAVLGLVLMTAQAFCYNAIFFTYALVLGRFYGVAPERCRALPAAVCRQQFPGSPRARPATSIRGGAAR